MLTGIFLAVTLLGTAWIQHRHEALSSRLSEARPVLFVLLGAAGLLGFAPLGMWQFGGWDGGSLILSGWYLLTGIIPYRDVPYTLPPSFFMGAGWGMRLFGEHWWAFVAVAAVFALLTYWWLLTLLRALGFRAEVAVAIAFVSELSTMMVAAFWWYNPETSIVVILMLASSLFCLAKPQARLGWMSLSGSLALLLLSKPNSWPAGACVAIVLFSRTPGARRRAFAAAAAGVIAAILLCELHGFGPGDVLGWYYKVAQTRGSPFTLEAVGTATALIAGCYLILRFILLLLDGSSEWRHDWREYGCCAAAALASVWMYLTNFELKTSDLAPLAVVMVVLAFRPWSERRFADRRLIAVMVMLGFAVLSCEWAVTRLRIRSIGEGAFFETPVNSKFESGFFAGLHTGPTFPVVVRQMGEALQQHPGRAFFGPRMEFGYAVFHQRAARGLPLFWHLGTAYVSGDVPGIVDAFQAYGFDTLIFLRDDRTPMPPELLRNIQQNYREVDDYSELTVYVRQTPRPATTAFSAP